jgi:hypothetical protein
VATRERITWSAVGVLAGVLTSAVGGSWYVSSAIAEEGRRGRQEAKELVTENQKRTDDLYAKREDVLVLQTKQDAILETLREVLRLLRSEEHSR